MGRKTYGEYSRVFVVWVDARFNRVGLVFSEFLAKPGDGGDLCECV